MYIYIYIWIYIESFVCMCFSRSRVGGNGGGRLEVGFEKSVLFPRVSVILSLGFEEEGSCSASPV